MLVNEAGATPIKTTGYPAGASAITRHWTKRLGPSGLTLAALGVVFGDIGTSPLYSLQTAFSLDHNIIEVTPLDVLGIISLVIWAIIIIVSVKYVLFVMRADNEGEGGILALTALLRHVLSGRQRLSALAIGLGMIGAGLFYGDSLITPAISVLSAVEGLQVSAPQLDAAVLPIAVVIICVLFAVQRLGTGFVGKAFGPVMTCWFITLGALGVPQIAAHPGIIRALSPTYAIEFWVQRPAIAFIAMGAVVLAITGAEALYADMGHFGARPIRQAWFGLVLPALILNYLGQGALILDDPTAIDSPFFKLAPEWARVPLVVLATLATVIAAQAVISGAFSVTNQAMKLGLLPSLSVRHTSSREYGQIYIPVINWLLFAGVLALTLGFRSSTALANAYGLAVTGTELLTTSMLALMAHHAWRWRRWKLLLVVLPIAAIEVTFLAANATKFFKGGWLPVLVALVVIMILTTWQIGSRYVLRRRAEIEGSLPEFLERIAHTITARVPGEAVYLHANPETAPLALKENVRFNRALHERVFIVQVLGTTTPYVAEDERVQLDPLPEPHTGINHLTIRIGFNERRDIPAAIAQAAERFPELGLDAEQVRYFASVMTLHPGGESPMAGWRKRLYIWLARNAAGRGEAFHLPPNRTMIMGGTLYL